jgi:hypothetical protein
MRCDEQEAGEGGELGKRADGDEGEGGEKKDEGADPCE